MEVMNKWWIEDWKIIHQHLYYLLHHIRKDSCHTMLKNSGGITQTKRHSLENECTIKTCESHLLLVCGSNGNLVIPWISIKALVSVTRQSIQHFVNKQKWEMILPCSLVELYIVYANSLTRYRSIREEIIVLTLHHYHATVDILGTQSSFMFWS